MRYPNLKRRAISLLLLVAVLMSLVPVSMNVQTTAAEMPSASLAKQEGAVRAAVPSVSAPFTTHPTVFIVEDTYQIAFATDATGIAWVEIEGTKYEDASYGLMNWNSKYHKITVPQSALDTARSYSICFRSLANRPTSKPAPGETQSRTYSFDPVPEDRDPVFYCSSDQRGNNTYDLAISQCRSFDVYVFEGDYVTEVETDENLKLLLDMTGSVTKGSKPTIYARGNREIRGSLSHELYRVSGYSETTGAYYRVEMPGIFALVLDAGEDKEDSHSDYAGTIDFETYRKEQTEWLRQIVADREWEKYPVRVVFCHEPFSLNTRTAMKPIYAEWTELLDQMGVSLVVSGHTREAAFYEPTASANKSDPNFRTVVVSDHQFTTEPYSYSGAFITASSSQYAVEIIDQDLAVKATKTIPTFTNAHIADSANTSLLAKESIEVTTTSVTKVPAVESPYTMHPSVFAVEDGYEIIFSTDATGMAWVEVGGKKYTDSTAGSMDWASKYHQIYVPRVALDTARSYTVCFQSMTSRPSYKPKPGETVSRTYPFTPMGDKAEPVILCLSDMRNLNAEAQTVATYQSFDVLYIGGDYASNGNSEENIKLMLSDCSAITSGTKPIVYTRGNREVRGAYAYLLEEVAPSTKSGKSYYTIEQNNLFAIVLDTGEDKVDSHTDYGGTVAYEKYRDEQTQWLREILESGVWKDYPTRIAFCHIPFTLYSHSAALKATYTEWTKILGQMGITLMISGNNYTHAIYPENSSSHYIDPSFPVITVSDVDEDNNLYTGTYIMVGQSSFTVENVSAEKELRSTNTVSNLTANAYWESSDSYLMFDFNDDAVAQERYHSSVYGGLNFDLAANWRNNSRATAPTVERGALSFSFANSDVENCGITSGLQGGKSEKWGYKPLHYIPKTTDYCQIRFKIDGAVATRTNGIGVFRLDLHCPNDIDDDAAKETYYAKYTANFNVSDVVGKGYTTLTFALNSDDYMKLDWVNAVQPQFFNIKSADGETATVTIDYLYIGPQETMPVQAENIFIDFSDTEADHRRYDSFTYNYLNLDNPSNWTAYNGSPLVSVSDNAMRLAVTDGNADSNFSVKSTGDLVNTMHYVPGQNDYLQVRVKIEDAVATASNGTASFIMELERPNAIAESDGTSSTSTNVTIDFNLNDHVDKGWFVLKTPLTNAEYLASDWINLLHAQFAGMKSKSGKTAAFYIDYIYIGPEEKLPGEELLYFDFKNDEAAKDRYSSATYNDNLNFDTISNWGGTWVSYGEREELTENHTQEGTITLVKTERTPNEWISIINTEYLRYRPGQAECVQIRCRFFGFEPAGNKTEFELIYAYQGSDEIRDEGMTYKFEEGFEFDGEYVIITVPVSENFTQREIITQIKPNFWNIDGFGTVDFDYIYIGTEEELPAPKVTFQNYDGAVLQTSYVLKGETPVYSGSTPTKTYDSDYHYTFKEWSPALGAISAATTYTATFTQETHTFAVKQNTVAPNCGTGAQGYTVYQCTGCAATEKRDYVNATHSYTYKATKDPTTSATGTLTGTCTGCGDTTTVTLPTLNTTDYEREIQTEATCTVNGAYKWTWKTTTYGTFSFTSVITAPGHTEEVIPAVKATCTTDGKTAGKKCSVCDTILQEPQTVTATGHQYEETVTKPTCTAQGYTTYVCSVCAHTYVDDYVDAGHTYGKETVVPPTCTEQGYTYKICSECQYEYRYSYVSANGHTEVTDSAVAPTCTTAGKTEGSHCEVCGEIFVAQEEIAAKGHTVVIDEAVEQSCTTTGLTEGSHCEVCNMVFTAQEEIPATGHNYDKYVDNGNGTHSLRCANCDDRTAPEAHSFNSEGLCVCGASNKIGSLEADPIDVVLDFAKPMTISVRNRAVISAVTRDMLKDAEMSVEFATMQDAQYGDVVAIDTDGDGLNDSVIFTPKRILSGIVTINCLFDVYFANADMNYRVPVPVRIIPATTVYYETDMSDSAIDFHVEGSADTKYDKKLQGTPEEEAQDSDNTKDRLYDLVIDRGGEIPGSAFFADFSNNAAAIERYSSGYVYKKTSYTAYSAYASSYINYDLTTNAWYVPAAYETRAIDNSTGTMTVKMTSAGADRNYTWIQTSQAATGSFWLNYHAQEDHYLQVRFKMKNVNSTKANGEGTVKMYYYVGGSATADNTNLFEGGSGTIPADAFKSGEYITVTFPLSNLPNNYANNHNELEVDQREISVIRVHFGDVQSVSTTETAEFIIDYIYCGPNVLKSESEPVVAMDHNSVNAPYLFFNFNNDAYSQKRYKDSMYLLNDYDTKTACEEHWVVATGDPTKTTVANKNVVCTKDSGYLLAPIGSKRTDNNNSSYVSATMTTNDFPWTTDDSNKADYALNMQVPMSLFEDHPDLKYYGIVSFTLTNVKKADTSADTKLQFSLLDGSALASGHKYEQASFTFKNDTYTTVIVDLTDEVKALNGKVASFYVRFINIVSAVSNDYGTAKIDYIYIGTEPTRANAVYYNRTTERNLLIDFRNTKLDQERYKAVSYNYHNYDNNNLEAWVTTDMSATINNTTGVMTLKPSGNYNSNSGTGSIVTAASSVTSATVYNTILGYYISGKNDYVVVRMRHNGLQAKNDRKFQITIGSGERYGRPNETFDGEVIPTAQFSKTLDTANDGKWVTYVFNISSAKNALNSWMSFLYLDFAGVLMDSIEIDYIYIGELVDAAPPEESLYFGFENTASDKERYDSASYGYVNYDTNGDTKFLMTNLGGGGVVNNADGTLTLTADSKTISTFAIATENHLNFHTKGKTVQVRFKTEGFVEGGDAYAPYFFLQYGEYPYTQATAESFYYNPKYLSNGRYVTVTFELTEEIAEAFHNADTVNRLRFYFGGMVNADNSNPGKIIIDYIYIGPKDKIFETVASKQIKAVSFFTKSDAFQTDMTYGYDSSYLTDGEFSNGSSYFVEGLGIPNFTADYKIDTSKNLPYTEFTFDFTGTGFEIISRTGPKQGNIRAMIYDKETGNFVQAAQVLCKSDTENDTHQVPVLSVTVQDEETKEPLHGTYTVKLYVAAEYDFGNDGNADMFIGALDRGGEFYFDAIRVYNTIDTSAKTEEAEAAYDAYYTHGELDPTFREVKSFIVDPQTYEPGGDNEGVLYYEPGKDKDGNVFYSYTDASPNNEVYLNAGKAITFKLEVEGEIPASVDIGLKRINETSASVAFGIGKNAPNVPSGENATLIESTTALYYRLAIDEWNKSGSTYSVYITIYNCGESGMLSITNVKYAYGLASEPISERARSVRFIVDADLMEKLSTPCEHVWDNGTVRIEATCTNLGVKVYACANCDETKTEEIAMLEHTYVDGHCTCGAEKSAEPKYDGNLGMTMNISVGAEMQVVYTVRDAQITNYESFYVEVVKDVVGGESVKTVFSLGNGNMDEISAPNGNLVGYSATYTGIFAMEMGDNFTATLYAVAEDGTVYYGDSESSSIKSYLMEKLADNASSAELKTLAVDMLNYGAAAQVNFGYDVENPVNADLTEEQKTLGTQTIPEAVNSSLITGTGYNISTGVSLQSKVLLYLTCLYPSDENSTLKFVVKDQNGKALEAFAPTVQTAKGCQGLYANVGARQMREKLTIELYDGDTPVSKTLTWSVESYVASIRANEKSSPELIAAANAMLTYGDSAAVYLEATGQ